jgi:Domain of unknown function (DUF3883)
MSDIDPIGKDWSANEIDLVIAAYFEMLALEVAQKPYVKAQHNKALQELIGRTKGSIEFKFQNISAVLIRLGLPTITGYAPMSNFQHALLTGIERYLVLKEDRVQSLAANPQPAFSEGDILYFEAPPSLLNSTFERNETLERLAKKFDPAKRDERNRELGKRGEELVLNFERSRLRQERPDLATKVKWVSQDMGDGAGFDILSYEATGKERLIEVKTTIGSQRTPFFISSNEYDLSNEKPDKFRLVRVFDFTKKPRAFELSPPLLHSLMLTPHNYRASFQ